MILVKRAYDPIETSDGSRFLVDRLWPRGIRKEALAIRAWCKDAAPSHELRRWYHHDAEEWEEFCRRYFLELESHPAAWSPLLEEARHGDVTLLFGARNVEQNNAVALKKFLTQKLGSR